MTKLTPTQIQPTSITPAPVAAAISTTYKFPNDGHTVLRVNNTSVTDTISVVVYGQRLCNAGLLHNVTIDLGPGDSKFIGPFQKTRFDDAEHYARLTFGNTATITYCVLKL